MSCEACEVLVVVEQPAGEAYRIRYNPETRVFARTEALSLLHHRGFLGAYGWVDGSGTPPAPHHDILILTDQPTAPGDQIAVRVCGMFVRADGDHKFVGVGPDVLPDEPAPDFEHLPERWRRQLHALYPEVGPGEGWQGARSALSALRRPAEHD